MSDKTPNNIEPKLKDIGYFRTTDRTYEETLKYSNIDNEYIQLLEQDAKVVEMGSGLHQKFANGLKLQRPDITVISIDPSLGVDLNEEFISLTEKKGDEVNAIHYYEKNPKSDPKYFDSEQQVKATKDNRIKIAQKTGNVIVGVAPSVPLAKGSVNLFVDNYGPCLYIEREKMASYIRNITDALKDNGEAYLFPIDYYGDLFNLDYQGESVENRNTRIKEVFIEIMKAIPECDYEFYKKLDPNQQKDKTSGNIVDNYRIGAKIKKRKK